jgi:LmbE family N-acetylglucosaminyl deacetylase
MRRTCLVARLALVVALGATPPLLAQRIVTGPPPDPRFKADILLLVAHPDDDVLAGSYLAKAIYDDGKRVAVAFMTSGDSGGNQQGPERAATLGLIRQTEARKDLTTLGISNVWFLSGHDTAGQDPVRSLANWGHARVLSEAVRVVRLTRPDVILTWLPMQVAGENHGDHQASSVIATEAFDLAGDPTAFPEQLAAPVEQFEPLFEGLRPWQPSKLYFMSDAMDTRFMDGHGPAYPVTAVSPTKGRRYWEFAYEQLRAHVTQYRVQLEQLASADAATRERMLTQAPPGDALLDPFRLLLGKSLTGGSATGDMFEGIGQQPASVARAPGTDTQARLETSIALGGPWRFYRRFWRAHGLDVLSAIDLHDIGPVGGGGIRVPLVAVNPSDQERRFTVSARLPEGWREEPRDTVVVVASKGEVEFTSSLVGRPAPTGGVVEVTYSASADGVGSVPSLTVRIVLAPSGNPLPRQ